MRYCDNCGTALWRVLPGEDVCPDCGLYFQRIRPLIHAACEAQELFGDDALEAFADALQRAGGAA